MFRIGRPPCGCLGPSCIAIAAASPGWAERTMGAGSFGVRGVECGQCVDSACDAESDAPPLSLHRPVPTHGPADSSSTASPPALQAGFVVAIVAFVVSGVYETKPLPVSMKAKTK